MVSKGLRQCSWLSQMEIISRRCLMVGQAYLFPAIPTVSQVHIPEPLLRFKRPDQQLTMRSLSVSLCNISIVDTTEISPPSRGNKSTIPSIASSPLCYDFVPYK